MAESDMDLLRKFARTRSDDVFATLVRRHADLVFSAALRQTRSKVLAEEITQVVFLELLRSAVHLREDTVLAAWLYEITRRKSVDVIRRETRRRERERTAITNLSQMNDDDSRWGELEPLLDDAMADLDEKDRAAVILRFFENQSLREVGRALGVSEDTAQKRVSRAIDRLRDLFAARGALASSTAIAAGISAHAIQAAPAALVAGLTAGSAAVPAVTTALFMTALQKVAIVTLLTAGIGTALYEHIRSAKLTQELRIRKTAEAKRAHPGFQQEERQALLARVSALEQENARLRRNSSEVPRLRAEVTRLSERERERLPAEGFAGVAMEWKEKEGKLRRLMDAQPGQRVPEMDLLPDRVWLDTARDADLDTEAGVRKAFSELRHVAKNTFVMSLSSALGKYTQEHQGELPATLSDVKPYFTTPVTDAMLDEYQLVHTGKVADLPRGEYPVSEKSVVDPDYDRL